MNNNEMSAGTNAEQSKNDEVTTSSHSNGNTNVVGSQSLLSNDLQIDVTESRVWVQIGNVGVGFEKENFVKLIEQSESYKYALSLRE
jgi:hypothetical protein